MARDEPLLAPRPSSDHSSIRNAEEEDALLTGEQTNRGPERRGWAFWREVGLSTWAMLATVAVIVYMSLIEGETVQERWCDMNDDD